VFLELEFAAAVDTHLADGNADFPFCFLDRREVNPIGQAITVFQPIF
jgi:hypothetical protein